MAKYDVRVRYTFEGTYKVVAEDRDEAERIVTEDCGLVLGGNIHTTRDDDEVTDWRFGSHPDMQILSFRERVDKGKVRYTSMCHSVTAMTIRYGSSGSGKTAIHMNAG